MKANNKKKPKKKKQPPPVSQAPLPRARGFYKPPDPSHEDLWGSWRYMEVGNGLYPAQQNAERGEQNGALHRGPRSLSTLSLQMGNLLIAGHLAETERPAQPPQFDTRSQRNRGRGVAGGRRSSFGYPPEDGVRRYHNREERQWQLAGDRATQLRIVQEARAEHCALARAGHEIKVMCLTHLMETRRLQHQEMAWMLEIERALIEMWHCPLHILKNQDLDNCICCDHNQTTIARCKFALVKNAERLRKAAITDNVRRNHMHQVDEATWEARLEQERAEGHLNFRFRSDGSWVESRDDDSPYSTDRFEEDEGKHDDSPLVPPASFRGDRHDDSPHTSPPSFRGDSSSSSSSFGGGCPPSYGPPSYGPPDYESPEEF